MQRRTFGVVALAAAIVLAIAIPAWAHQDTPDSDPTSSVTGTESINVEAAGKVLILGSSVYGPAASSLEATYATSLGLGVDIVDDPTWTSMSTADFAAYSALIIGDNCRSAPLTVLNTTAATWAPAVTGNIIVVGTDPATHEDGGVNANGGILVTQKAIDFSLGQAGKTGIAFMVSCLGYGDPNAQNPALNALASGWDWGSAGCGDAIHVVATNPLLLGLTDGDLSDWGCSVHEYATAWPSDFVPIALDTDAPNNFTSSDGFSGSPYILGRGAGLTLGNISLSPETGIADAGTDYVLTALVQEGGTALANTVVTFTCKRDGDADVTGDATTSSSGVATFGYTRLSAGVDTCTASYVDSKAQTQTSNSVTVEWTGAVELQPNFTG